AATIRPVAATGAAARYRLQLLWRAGSDAGMSRTLRPDGLRSSAPGGRDWHSHGPGRQARPYSVAGAARDPLAHPGGYRDRTSFGALGGAIHEVATIRDRKRGPVYDCGHDRSADR